MEPKNDEHGYNESTLFTVVHDYGKPYEEIIKGITALKAELRRGYELSQDSPGDTYIYVGSRDISEDQFITDIIDDIITPGEAAK